MSLEMATLLRLVRQYAGTPECGVSSDAQLLQQFVAERDEAAFAAILHRHGPLVFGVCRRVLCDLHDAEDVFQATFLVLARKADSIRQHDSLPAWLYRVALNIARMTKAGIAHRRTHEQQAVPMTETNSIDDVALRDWQAVIHEEVDQLSEKYRMPIILCYFEGKTHDEAARQLNWPLGTVKGRLARGRDRLRARLERRGLVLGAGAVVAVLTHNSVLAKAPGVLVHHTLQAAVCFARGVSIPAGAVSTHALRLANGAVSTMTSTRLLSFIVTMLSAALLVAYSLVTASSPTEAVAVNPHRDQVEADAQADPLPPGARARMGTPRFRHGGPVSSMAYLDGGKILATGGAIGTHRQTGIGRIRLWDAATGKELRQFHVNGAAHIAASPDGKILAGTDERDGIVYLWEAATGKEIRQLKSSRSGFGGVLPIAFSGDGKKLAAGGHQVRIWDVETGKLLQSQKDRRESVIALAFSADGKNLALKHCDVVPPRIIQIDPWQELVSLKSKRDVELLALSPDSKTLAITINGSGSIFLHDPLDGRQLREIQAHQVRNPLRPAKFWLTPEEARKLDAGQQLDLLGQKRINALVFSPDGKTLASAAADNRIRLWDVATGKERQAFPADAFSGGALVFAPDGKSLAWASSAGLIRIWDLQTGKPTHGHDGHQGIVTSVALSDVGKTLITAGADASIRIWETATGKELRRLEGHQAPIASIHLSPDGKSLASVSPADKTVRVWELTSGKELRRFRASTTYCDAAWMPDSRTLVIRRYFGDSTVHFCDVMTGQETLKIDNVEPRDGMNFPANFEGVHHGGIVAISPDGKMLVTSVDFMRPSFHLWDTATGKELPLLPPSNQPTVRTAVFSPDSKSLVIGSGYFGTVDVWDIAAREARPMVISHFKVKDPNGQEHEVPTYLQVNFMALSPDGKTLATAGGEPIIRLWDVANGKERGRLEGHRGAVTSLAWSTDGNTLASASNDGTALIWDVSGRPGPKDKE